mmetsp:Transcript_42701/g.117859  ORF Transcript_42701/g.117859 Transcript_42701/m.117859 type:complete len:268 (-) Transcript_42701:283-1086(-)
MACETVSLEGSFDGHRSDRGDEFSRNCHRQRSLPLFVNRLYPDVEGSDASGRFDVLGGVRLRDILEQVSLRRDHHFRGFCNFVCRRGRLLHGRVLVDEPIPHWRGIKDCAHGVDDEKDATISFRQLVPRGGYLCRVSVLLHRCYGAERFREGLASSCRRVAPCSGVEPARSSRERVGRYRHWADEWTLVQVARDLAWHSLYNGLCSIRSAQHCHANWLVRLLGVSCGFYASPHRNQTANEGRCCCRRRSGSQRSAEKRGIACDEEQH